jgi:hypothetical protein
MHVLDAFCRFVTGVAPIELIDHHKFEKVRVKSCIFGIKGVLCAYGVSLPHNDKDETWSRKEMFRRAPSFSS